MLSKRKTQIAPCLVTVAVMAVVVALGPVVVTDRPVAMLVLELELLATSSLAEAGQTSGHLSNMLPCLLHSRRGLWNMSCEARRISKGMCHQ